jgi:ABC-type lipoprotein export system ATPase subunit
MLETKELVKIYKPKKGVPVTAIDKISLKFSDRGMVFLLGKSGSGKSTLLNLLGGLDKYDSGEIIVKGVSSRDFKQSHFDSYRNTYVGFIFQEYNILDEFTVGANIALAIELQNRKATDQVINAILKEVDLEGFGDRKPNELSGGQKQRVAIARALVKKPEIIMADEPSGALDSATGKQIFDTLKKLSKDKLVIVVSHDREFAEQYADRIIELADGKVISDVELDTEAQTKEEKGISFNENTIEVPNGYHLTEQDRIAINEYIDNLESSLSVSVNTTKTNKAFKNTDQSKIMQHGGSKFKLIKSKLPLKNAFKIGANGLKYKKFRLVVTIILSCVAFGLFGLADTFAAYNHIETCTNSLADSDIDYLSVAKTQKVGENGFYWYSSQKFSQLELEKFKGDTGSSVYGVYLPIDSMLCVDQNIDISAESLGWTELYSSELSGFGTINDKIMNELGFKLLEGNLPDGSKNEIAISEYIFEVFKIYKYTDGKTTDLKTGEPIYTEIYSYSDMIGKTILLDGVEYRVTAIIDTNLDIERYIHLFEEDKSQTNADMIIDYVLYSEFTSAKDYSYSCVAMLGDGHLERMIENRKPISEVSKADIMIYSDNCDISAYNLAKLSDVKNQKIVWLDGEKKTLKENEIIISTDNLSVYDENGIYIHEAEEFDYAAYLKKNNKLSKDIYYYDGEEEISTCEIVGYIPADYENYSHVSAVICDDKTFEKLTGGSDKVYSFAVGSMPKEKQELKDLVSYCYKEDNNIRYQIQNAITFELDSVNEILVGFSKTFVYVGLFFAIFAALMLSNFIAISISYKKEEIGILRAIGSRSNDVFRIFFSESFIIAMINFVLSTIGVFAVTNIINGIVRNELGILITILSFTPRQIILLLAVSILVAFVASFFPVKKIASKRPIDAIRDR